MADEKAIPIGGFGKPNASPYDLTGDPVWKKGVCKRVEYRGPEKHYRGNEDGDEAEVRGRDGDK